MSKRTRACVHGNHAPFELAWRLEKQVPNLAVAEAASTPFSCFTPYTQAHDIQV